MSGNLQEIIACERDGAGGRLIETRDAIETRRLACSVRSDEAGYVPFLDLKRDVGERSDPTEPNGETIDPEEH